MGKSIIITESQFNRLFNKPEDLVNEVISPLREILKCRITEDRKYVSYLGRIYDAKTGDELPLTEQALGVTKALGTTGKVKASDDEWTLSDILHTGVDLVSTAADFIAPGSGAMIDVVHALSYIVEAEFESDSKKRDNLYLMGAITGMFAILPGALQAVAPILKRFVSTGGKIASGSLPVLKRAWGFISKNLSRFLRVLPSWVERALKSSIGKRILGKETSESILKSLKSFTGRIGKILDDLSKNTDKLIKNTKIAGRRSVDALSPMHYINKNKILAKTGNVIDLYTKTGKVNRAALGSINRKGGHKLFKDKIVFDFATGKPYSTTSKEGLQAMADNKFFLEMIKKGEWRVSDISKGVPLEFVKNRHYIPQPLLSKLPKPLIDNKMAINTVKTLDKSRRLSQLARKKILNRLDFNKNNSNINKVLGLKDLDKDANIFLKGLQNLTAPLKHPKKILTSLNTIRKGGNWKYIFNNKEFKERTGKTGWGYVGQIAGSLFMMELVGSIYAMIFCKLGIRNRDDVSKVIELNKWVTKYINQESITSLLPEETNQLESIAKGLAFVVDLITRGGDFVWGLIEQDCNEGLSNQYLSYLTPYLDEIPAGEIKDDLESMIETKDDIISNENINSLNDIEDFINSIEDKDKKFTDI